MAETRRYLVIGGCGFIGSHITDYLVDTGHEVLVLDALSSGSLKNIRTSTMKDSFIKGDVAKQSDLEKCIKRIRPHVIFNLAAMNLLGSLKDPWRDLTVTGLGTMNVLEIVRKKRFIERIVFASSGSVYGEAKYSPQDERHPLQPSSPYGASKLLAEKYHDVWRRIHGLSYSCLRLYNVYGPRQDFSRQGGVVPIFINRMMNRKRPMVEGSGKQRRCFTYVSDVVHAFELAAKHPRADGLTFNVASKEVCTILELIKKINKLLGSNLKPVFTEPRPGDIMDFRPDITLAETRLGYKPSISMNQGLSNTIDWLKSFN